MLPEPKRWAWFAAISDSDSVVSSPPSPDPELNIEHPVNALIDRQKIVDKKIDFEGIKARRVFMVMFLVIRLDTLLEA
jgi:hypothetical protein